MSRANEIANEARTLAESPAIAPGAQPTPLITAELLRNLASLVTDLAAYVEEVAAADEE
jgi:hypothetical protein